MGLAAVHFEAVDLLLIQLFNVVPDVCGGFVFGVCFVMQYFVFGEEESWLLYFVFLLQYGC